MITDNRSFVCSSKGSVEFIVCFASVTAICDAVSFWLAVFINNVLSYGLIQWSLERYCEWDLRLSHWWVLSLWSSSRFGLVWFGLCMNPFSHILPFLLKLISIEQNTAEKKMTHCYTHTHTHTHTRIYTYTCMQIIFFKSIYICVRLLAHSWWWILPELVDRRI